VRALGAVLAALARAVRSPAAQQRFAPTALLRRVQGALRAARVTADAA
jgi:hypothetical protein